MIYNKQGLREYILNDTNAQKQYHLPGGKLIGNKSEKYKEIIADTCPPSRSRSCKDHIYIVPRMSIDYVHWDDPNELVERLKLLKASQRSAHTGYTNEILSIIDELRKACFIV